ncbi:hypothetical protein [Haloimpatiens massiliensis]|uniref:hypothetical protein n=1 Tax=Haloimpatiens massiliensis TaxID=1658110 RepID=UPI000C81804C|nr:hypothetical protein [Haloimpatiens massiliensis]
MEFTIKKIISIDKNAQKFREKMDKKIHMESNKLENIILAMNEKSKIQIQKKQRYLMESMIEKANEEAKIILVQGKENLEEITEKFYKKENCISEEIFNEIIASLEEE